MKHRDIDCFDVKSDEFIRSSFTTFIHRADEAVYNIHHDNSQSIHDFRIALRCLRTWLKAFGDIIGFDSGLTADVSSLATATNDCRDLEVFTMWLDHHIDCNAESQSFLNYVADIHQRHERAKHNIRTYVNDTWPVIGHRINETINHIDDSISVETEFTHLLYQALHKRVLKLSCQISEVPNAKEGERSATLLHKCRINIKQIRYLLDPFKDGNVQCKKLVRNIKSIQDQLGIYHDLWIFTATLYQDRSKYDGLYPLIESIEQQRHDRFSVLQSSLFSLPAPWLQSLENILTIIADKGTSSKEVRH